MSALKVLVAGATGYIGGRLVPKLLRQGHRVRCLAREPERLQGRGWYHEIEPVQADVMQAETLPAAMADIDVAYYLIHSMAAGPDFHQRDMQSARNFAEAAAAAGVQRIIYLGALADSQSKLSAHLRSRQQTADALRSAGVPLTEFRASVIVGSGSLSFEIIRYLTERLPVMICPRWVYTRTQPIAVDTVINYLTQALNIDESAGRIIEIGGSDVLSYGEMMMRYAEVRRLRRWMLRVPLLTPHLSSYWVNLVTPIPAAIARPLIEGLRNESIVRTGEARYLFPEIQVGDYRSAVGAALDQLDAGCLQSTWNDALSSSRSDQPRQLQVEQGMIIERRQQRLKASTAAAFQSFCGIGGERGWLYMDWAWRLRGFIDRLLGGVGMRRGRRDPDQLQVGEALDFWRVEAIEQDRLLRLRAEMKVPGQAWLQFDVERTDDGQVQLTQTAFFAPRGLSGWLYWYLLYPLHALIFSGMSHRLARRAEDLDRQQH